MKLARIKFTEAQVRLLVIGQTVKINLPDAEVHLTMDTTRIDLRKAAEKLKNIGAKAKPKSSAFGGIFDGLFEKDSPFSDLFD